MKKEIIKKANEISEKIRENSAKVDMDNVFPFENIEILKQNNFMYNFIEYDNPIELVSQISQIFGAECLSTAMIWAMHCQQVFLINNHVNKEKKEKLLSEITSRQLLLASITSEYSGKNTLNNVKSAFKRDDEGKIVFKREAPFVSASIYADAYLTTLKSQNNRVNILFLRSSDIEKSRIKKWDSMGMRGTQTDSMIIKGKIHEDNLISENIKDVLDLTMVPIGHILWASCWIGAAKKAYNDSVEYLRSMSISSEKRQVMYYQLSEVNMKIDIVNEYLKSVINLYSNSTVVEKTSIEFKIKVNNLKMTSSKLLFESINELIEIVGVSVGYNKNNITSLERTFRDLRSASLMFPNNSLKLINGKLILFNKFDI